MATSVRRRPQRAAGFSILELMIALAIIGLLASLALPFFHTYQLRSKSAEVKSNLGALRVLEESYFASHDEFLPAAAEPPVIPGATKAAFNPNPAFTALGFRPEGRVYFSYGVAVAADRTGYSADAAADIDADGFPQTLGVRKARRKRSDRSGPGWMRCGSAHRGDRPMRTGTRHLDLLMEPSPSSPEDALRERFERLQALRSAWGVLAPSEPFADRSIVETGRALSQALTELAQGAPANQEAAIAAFDSRLEELEREMRDIALEVPVAQLRATLPEQLTTDRRGVLDLLDLILGAEIRGLEGTRARIPTLDYVITLLCTGGDPHAPFQDPVALTHRLHRLCEHAAIDSDPGLAEIEADFNAAAERHEADLRNEVELRAMRRRKMELERNFFAPGVLRAIVTYNAAQMRCIDQKVLRSQNWGTPPRAEAADEGGSLYERPALAKLAEALRRRAAGNPPALDPVDRIAWCLDLADLTGAEREALLSESTGHREGLEGTTILVGLLCRSAVVLEEELPAIGIPPSELSGAWSQELADLLQQEVNQRIAVDYSGASALTDLKSRFLTAGPRRTRIRRTVQPAAQIRDDASERAEEKPAQPTREALESRRKASAAPGWRREWPWARIARAGGLGLLVLLGVALVDAIVWGEGRVSTAELEQLSPFLSDGKRSERGTGTAFAGTLDDEWSELEPAQQARAADALVAALRGRGLREIMVYDSDQRLRIQALGGQPARVVR